MNTKSYRPSCTDVARQAGVSQATVSRVFSADAAKVSEKSRNKVLKAAAELKYHPSIIARGLSKNSTQIIGVIVTRFENSFYTESIQHFTRFLQDAGYTAMVFNSDPGDMESTLPLVFQYQVDGIIIASTTLSKSLVVQCADLGIPVVAYNRYSPNLPISAVSSDNYRIGYNAADYFCRLGHKRCAFLGGDIEAMPPIKERVEGFIYGLRENGQELFAALHGGNTYQTGYDLGKQMLGAEMLPDAIFCCNYMVGIGAIDAAKEEFGLRVPDDVSIMGFYDHPLAASCGYRLTTVRLPVKEIAWAAVEILLDAIKSKNSHITSRMFPGEIIERGSVKNRST